MPLPQNSPLLNMFEPISRPISNSQALANTDSLSKFESLSSTERRKLPLTLGLSMSFFLLLPFRLVLKKEKDEDSTLSFF